VQATLIVELEDFGLAFFDVFQVEIEDLREPGPQNVDGDLF